MKKIIFILLFICLINNSFAYVKPEYYNGVRLKFYNEDIVKENCYHLLDIIPEKYYYDIQYIKILPKSNYYGGLYWWQVKGIDLFEECNKEVFIHELAHHCQYKRGDRLYQGKKHIGHFNECEDEIWESLN